MSKIIKFGENLTEFWRKQFCFIFDTQCTTYRGSIPFHHRN